MELLLKQRIDSLGRVGDVVDVKPGYARNYLMPLGLAVPVTKANLAQLDKARAEALVEEAQRLEQLKGQIKELGDTSITIEGRANDEGHLFGSVSKAQIVAALTEKGFPVEERHVRLEQPLREIGVFDVPVVLHSDLEATIKVWVVQAKPE